MADWDGPYCVTRFIKEAGLEDANELDADTDIYPALSRAQELFIARACQIVPDAFYTSAPFLLTPSADRKTFSFGNDPQGNPNVGMGWVQIAPNANAFSGNDTFVGWVKDRDFYDEGSQIRIGSNRSYSGNLYCRAVLTPPTITALQPPVIDPAIHRRLVVILAVQDWASEGNQFPSLAKTMQGKFDDRDTGFPAAMMTYKKRWRQGGAGWDPARWYFATPDLGSMGNANT
jgi:hypothetical protein